MRITNHFFPWSSCWSLYSEIIQAGFVTGWNFSFHRSQGICEDSPWWADDLWEKVLIMTGHCLACPRLSAFTDALRPSPIFHSSPSCLYFIYPAHMPCIFGYTVIIELERQLSDRRISSGGYQSRSLSSKVELFQNTSWCIKANLKILWLWTWHWSHPKKERKGEKEKKREKERAWQKRENKKRRQAGRERRGREKGKKLTPELSVLGFTRKVRNPEISSDHCKVSLWFKTNPLLETCLSCLSSWEIFTPREESKSILRLTKPNRQSHNMQATACPQHSAAAQCPLTSSSSL